MAALSSERDKKKGSAEGLRKAVCATESSPSSSPGKRKPRERQPQVQSVDQLPALAAIFSSILPTHNSSVIPPRCSGTVLKKGDWTTILDRQGLACP